MRPQHAGDDLAEPSIAEDDDLAMFVERVSGAAIAARVEARRHQPVKEEQQDRCRHHRQRYRDHQKVIVNLGEGVGALGELQHDKGELASLTNQNGDQEPITQMHAEERGQNEEDDDLDADDGKDCRQQPQRLGPKHREGNGHAPRR